jgi:putative transposase
MIYTHIMNMRLTAQVKIVTSEEENQALKQTLAQVNQACNWVSAWSFEHRTFRQFDLHQALYYEVRSRFSLPAQMVVRCFAKVADAYKLDKRTQRTFSSTGAIPYDDRILTWYVSTQRVSILSTTGRLKLSFVCGERQRTWLASRRGESDLVYCEGAFYLLAACDVVDPTPKEVADFLGVDLGIVNLATDSEGASFSGGTINGLRKRHAKLRARLQAKQTPSARRLLKKRQRQESRFARDVNHCLSKKLVAKAEGTNRGIALEDLKGIRSRITVRKAQRRTQHSWGFAQLRRFVDYKAVLTGVIVRRVDPRYTSQTCPRCTHVSRSNRPSQSLFRCTQCGFSGPADAIAAENIRRAAVNRPDAVAA